MTEDTAIIDAVLKRFNTKEAVASELEATKDYWLKKVIVRFKTGNADFDKYMQWVAFQPFLRRIYGCSFLPYHDYGRGGRGWRDLWQDCLSLLFIIFAQKSYKNQKDEHWRQGARDTGQGRERKGNPAKRFPG